MWWYVCLCSGGTEVTVVGDNVNAAAKPIISVTVSVTRFNSSDVTEDNAAVYTQSTCQSTVISDLICYTINDTLSLSESQ